MSRIIMHIDLNAFFATAEELRHPEYVGKPLGIGGEGRSGIVSTCNYAARKFGVHSGMPTFQAQRACPSLIMLPGDYEYYRIMSNSFIGYLHRFTPLVEQASIDEAYVDMSEPLAKAKDPIAYLRSLQNGLKEETGLSCSIGIAPTKWLAKMASDMKKPMGLVIVHKREIPSLIFPLPIDAFWGIGKKTAPLLRESGIMTIGDLSAALEKEDPVATKILGKFAATCREWLKGEGDDHVETESPDAKSIGNSETLMRDIQTFDEAEPTLRKLCRNVAGRARAAGKVGHVITLTVKDSLFHLHSKAFTLDEATDQELPIFRVVAKLFSANYDGKDGLYIRLLGVSLGRLEDKARQTVQMTLWNYEEYEKMDRTKLLIAQFNREFDHPMFSRASEAKKGKKNGPR